MSLRMLNTTSDARNPDFRFTLRGLMILVVFAALGSTLVRYDLSRWHDGFLVVVVGWFLIGISNQLFDLLRAGYRAENSSWNARGTVAVEFLRRILLSLVLVGYLAWIVLRSPAIATDEINRRLSWIEWGMPESLFLLALMSGVLLRNPPRDIVTNRSLRIVRDLILGIGCGVWLFYLYRDRLFIHELVQRAIRGVLAKLRFINVHGDAHDLWMEDCTQSAITAALAAVLAIIFTKTLVLRWKGGRSRELLWIFPLALSLSVAGWEISWATFVGLPNVAPCWFYFEEALTWPAAINLSLGVIVLLLFVTETTLRAGQVHDSNAEQRIQWRLRPRSYTHERQATLVLLAVTIIGWLATEIIWRGVENFLVEIRPTAWRTVQASLPKLMLDSPTVLKVACVLLAIHVWWWQRRSSEPPADISTAPILLLKFCVVWVAILATAICAILSLLWLYYAIVLMPQG
jgi:hypothetical protein